MCEYHIIAKLFEIFIEQGAPVTQWRSRQANQGREGRGKP